MKVVTLIAVLILIAGVMVIFLPELIMYSHQSTHSISIGLNHGGNIIASAGSPDAASILYDGSLAIEPENFDAVVSKGDALASSGKHLEALDMYSKSLTMKPDSVAVMKKKSDILKTLGRTTESQTLLMNIAQAHPGDPSDQMTVLKSSLLTGNYRDAVKKVDELLKTQPNNAELWEIRGDALFGLVSKDTSLKEELKDLQTKKGSSSEKTVISALQRNQAFSEGINSYRQALLLSPMRSTAIGNKMLGNFQNFDISISPEALLQ